MAQTYQAYIVSIRRWPGEPKAEIIYEYEDDGKKCRVKSLEAASVSAWEGEEVEITVEDDKVLKSGIRRDTRVRNVLAVIVVLIVIGVVILFAVLAGRLPLNTAVGGIVGTIILGLMLLRILF